MQLIHRYTFLKSARFFIWLLLLLACSEKEEVPIPNPPEQENQHLVSSQFLRTIDKDQIALLVSFYEEYSEYKDWIQYGIDFYRMSYSTTYQDRQIQASGVLAIPKGLKEKVPLLAGLHGTIIKHNQAPSQTDPFSEKPGLEKPGAEILASLGFITAVPDYIGFGDSEDIFHPYYDYLSTGRAVTDMLLATRELLDELEIPYQNNLFITGYSEGGYASVATLKYIEENDLDFNIKATAAGAGGYDVKNMMDHILENEAYNSPAYLVYIIYAYNITNNWNRPLTDLFLEPYASQIPAFMDGTLTIGEINGKLPKNIHELFNPNFLKGLKDETDTQFMKALEKNSLNNWAPRSHLRLYHENDDEIIPIANSEVTYESMIARGAEHTAFFPYDDATSHATGLQPMYKMVIPWFISLN